MQIAKVKFQQVSKRRLSKHFPDLFRLCLPKQNSYVCRSILYILIYATAFIHYHIIITFLLHHYDIISMALFVGYIQTKNLPCRLTSITSKHTAKVHCRSAQQKHTARAHSKSTLQKHTAILVISTPI